LHEVRRAHHHHHLHHHLHHPRGTEEEDVFTTVASTVLPSKIRSAAHVTAAQAFGKDDANGGRGFSGSRRGEADGGGAGAVDTWVDTDTDPDCDDDGLCEVDAD
jgi:hypothetical protein